MYAYVQLACSLLLLLSDKYGRKKKPQKFSKVCFFFHVKRRVETQPKKKEKNRASKE